LQTQGDKYPRPFPARPGCSGRSAVTPFTCHAESIFARRREKPAKSLVRQYFLKKTSLAYIDKQDVAAVQNKLINRPGKTINFATLGQLFFNSLVALGT